MTSTADIRRKVRDLLSVHETPNNLIWTRPHNRAVMRWETSTSNLSLGDAERAILDLAAGIYSWTGLDDDERGEPRGADGFGAPNVTWELVCAFRNALNFELGDLDGGTLDSFACTVCERCGLNPDTGAFK